MPNIFSLLGRRIKQERKARHLTQQELADAVGIDTGHLSRIESGKTPPSLNVVKNVADALRLPIARLFEDVPLQPLPADGWTGKMATLVRELPPKRRAKVFQLLKAFAEKD